MGVENIQRNSSEILQIENEIKDLQERLNELQSSVADKDHQDKVQKILLKKFSLELLLKSKISPLDYRAEVENLKEPEKSL